MSKLTAICLAAVLGVATLQSWPPATSSRARPNRTPASFATGWGGKFHTHVGGGTANLAGMNPGRFVSALKAYRSGQRFHPFTEFFVIPLSDQDMEDLVACYASLGRKQ